MKQIHRFLRRRELWWVFGSLLVIGLLAGGMFLLFHTPALAIGNVRISFPILSKGFCYATAKGKVVDAKTSQGVAGASVCYHANCVSTDGNGNYTLQGVPIGSRTISVNSDYYLPVDTQTSLGSCQATIPDIAIYPSQGGGTRGLRVVLSWSSTKYWPSNLNPCSWTPNGYCPNDLDTYLWFISSVPERSSYLLSSSDDKGDCYSYPGTCIEADKITGTGPETLSIRSFEFATYYYAVLNYYQGRDGVPLMANSQARARIYELDYGKWTTLDDLYVPTDGNGDLWYIFKLEVQPDPVNPENSIATYTKINCLTAANWPPAVNQPPQCPPSP